jgi:hypothetical protein
MKEPTKHRHARHEGLAVAIPVCSILFVSSDEVEIASLRQKRLRSQ